MIIKQFTISYDDGYFVVYKAFSSGRFFKYFYGQIPKRISYSEFYIAYEYFLER